MNLIIGGVIFFIKMIPYVLQFFFKNDLLKWIMKKQKTKTKNQLTIIQTSKIK